MEIYFEIVPPKKKKKKISIEKKVKCFEKKLNTSY